MARQSLAWAAVMLAVALTAGGLGYYKYAEISAAIAAAKASPEPREAVEAVQVRGGDTLEVNFRKTPEGAFREVTLLGPAEFTFEGTIDL